MINMAILILIGAFIGWNLPQPPWAVWMQAKLVEFYNTVKAKFGS